MTTQSTLSGTATSGVEVLLSDGSVATVRPVVLDDLPALLELHRQGSERSRRLRFFATGRSLAEQYAKHLVDAADGHLAVVATRAGALLGVASAEPIPNLSPDDPHQGEAEVALFVNDRCHHTGVGTILLEHISAAARAAGIARFSALVLLENAAMFDVFVHAGFDVHFDQPADGQIAVTLDLRGSRPLAAAIAERERRSTAASIAPLLSPRSVVVVGAGRHPGTIGHAVLGNLRGRSFTGRLAAVNRHVLDGETIHGVPAYRSVGEVPWRADLVVIAVPPREVAGVLEAGGAAGAHGAVVLTSGFAEAGDREGQAKLVRIAHRHGIRLIGPNCLGVVNTDPAIRLDATFARTTPNAGEYGGIGLAAQSGALGIAVLDAAWRRGLGVSSFVSLGNKADVSGNDMLLYWAGDPHTQVIALYLESIGNPRRFRRIAGSISRSKPIVALRGGRSVAGARAGASHTAAAATPDAVALALFRDTGVIAVDTTDELTEVAALLAVQPVPAGRRIVIVSNAGGPGALAADVAVAAGAELPRLSSETAARLKETLLAVPSVQNPVDLGVEATPEVYRTALKEVLNSGEADAVIVLHVETTAQSADAVIAAVELAEQEAKLDPGTQAVTVAAALIGGRPPRSGRLPWYGSAESAARSMARAGVLGSWRAQAPAPVVGAGEIPIPADIDTAAVLDLLRMAPRSDDGWLSISATTRLLQLIGVPVCATREVRGAKAAVTAAAEMNGPVVVKSAALGVTHKSDLGAVALGVSGEAQVTEAVRRIQAATGSEELIIQPLMPSGLELLVGLSAPAEGVPVAMVAAGGIHEELFDDRVLRTLPLGPGIADRMVSELRCAPLLTGHRGSPVLNRAGVIDVLERIALLDVIAPQIRELDVNPLVVSEGAVIGLDARIRVAIPGEAPRRRDRVNDDYDRALG